MNNLRNRKDVFHAWMVLESKFDGTWEIPMIHKMSVNDYKNVKFIPFDKMRQHKGFDYYVHFYIHDVQFGGIWNNPYQYLERLKKYKGVISADFSLYRDMPLAMQMWNTYRSRTVGSWLQNNGVTVIPNVRWGDERSYEFCFSGIEKGSIVAVGSHGTVKNVIDRRYFEKGLDYMLKLIEPKDVIIYGGLYQSTIDIFNQNHTTYTHIPCDTFTFAKKVMA